MSISVPVTVIAPKMYFTDGKRLYYIIHVHRDATVTVENCETLFTNRISVDTIYQGWQEVGHGYIAA